MKKLATVRLSMVLERKIRYENTLIQGGWMIYDEKIINNYNYILYVNFNGGM